MASLVSIGETLIDVVARPDGTISEHPGGSPANVAVAYARLAGHARLATWLGRDSHGDTAATWLAEAGVALVDGSRDAPCTSTALATVDRGGVAEYSFDLHWEVPSGLLAELESVRSPEIVHVGSLATQLEPGASAIERALDAVAGRATISFDPNLRPATISDATAARDRVERLVARSDVVKASVDDLVACYPGENPIAACHRWLDSGPALVVLTCGADGALAGTPAGWVSVAAEEVEVVDTVGAGDAFTGALLWALGQAGLVHPAGRHLLAGLADEPLRDLIACAVRASGLSVTRPGADPPTRAELEARSGKVNP